METDTEMHKPSSSGISILPGSEKYAWEHFFVWNPELHFQSQVVKTSN